MRAGLAKAVISVELTNKRCREQDPGIFGSPRTCLHSIMSILTCGGVGEQPACVESNPTLAHLCYNLVYKLCANPETSSSVLRSVIKLAF